MMPAIPAPSAAPPAHRIYRCKLVFWLPLVGYWFLAILMASYPQPPWVLVILGSPLVLMAFAINCRHFNGRAWGPSSLGGIVDHDTGVAAHVR